MDDDGNVLIKRTGLPAISVLAAASTGDRRQADMKSEHQGHMLETDKTLTMFDMNKFQKMLENSLRYRQGKTDKQQLELQVHIWDALSNQMIIGIFAAVRVNGSS